MDRAILNDAEIKIASELSSLDWKSSLLNVLQYTFFVLKIGLGLAIMAANYAQDAGTDLKNVTIILAAIFVGLDVVYKFVEAIYSKFIKSMTQYMAVQTQIRNAKYGKADLTLEVVNAIYAQIQDAQLALLKIDIQQPSVPTTIPPATDINVLGTTEPTMPSVIRAKTVIADSEPDVDLTKLSDKPVAVVLDE